MTEKTSKIYVLDEISLVRIGVLNKPTIIKEFICTRDVKEQGKVRDLL